MLRKGSLLAELTGEKKLFSSLKIINGGRALLVGGKDGSVVSYQLPEFKKTNAIYPNFEISVFAQTSDGTIMIGGAEGLLAAFDGVTLEEKWRRQAHDGIVSPILPHGDQVISASEDGAIAITDIESGEEVKRVRTFNGGKITDIVVINEHTLAAAHEKGRVAYIDLRTGKVLSSFKGHDGWVSSVDLAPDGSEIVTAGVNGNLHFFSLGQAHMTHSFRAHSDVASGAKFVRLSNGKKACQCRI